MLKARGLEKNPNDENHEEEDEESERSKDRKKDDEESKKKEKEAEAERSKNGGAEETACSETQMLLTLELLWRMVRLQKLPRIRNPDA